VTDRGHWENDPDFPIEDWQYQVANNDTRLGYTEWIASEREAQGSRVHNQDLHDPLKCEHEQCGITYEAGYIAGRKATADDLLRLAASFNYDEESMS